MIKIEKLLYKGNGSGWRFSPRHACCRLDSNFRNHGDYIKLCTIDLTDEFKEGLIYSGEERFLYDRFLLVIDS